jgi:2-(1,2-epoxy-1,2-dihydrophenyl)acetyl-CoA isomerase
MTDQASPVVVTQQDAVTWIRFNQPERLNAFDVPAVDAFGAALREAESDPTTRCVVVTGTGRAFSAGADVNRLRAMEDPSEIGAYLRETWAPVFQRLRTMPKPVICGLNGLAAGIAASVSLACDLRIAGEDAYLLEAFARIGLGPDGGVSWMLPRIVGRGKALEMFLLAQPLSAREAERLGAVNKVVPNDQVEAACAEWAAALAEAPSSALAAAKRAVNHAEAATFDEAFEFETLLQQACAAHPAFREGVAAFAEKRKADFAAAERAAAG